MKTLQLQKNLMHQIAEIDDVTFLNALKTIIEAKRKSTIISLTDEQRSEINKSKKMVEEGNTESQDAINQKFQQWLDVN